MTKVTCDYCGALIEKESGASVGLRPISCLSNQASRHFDLCPKCALAMLKYLDEAFTKNLLKPR